MLKLHFEGNILFLLEQPNYFWSFLNNEKHARVSFYLSFADDEIYGDFEDLETGDVISGNLSENESDEDKAEGDETDLENEEEGKDNGNELKTKAEKRAEKKRKLKEMFNSDYDGGKGIYIF